MTTADPNGGVGFQDVDPQRIYNSEDWAFFGATLFRTLTTFTPSADPSEANTLVPDAATGTGTSNSDYTQWSFTIRDGMKWQDGSPVTCEDFKYGVSRTFADDVIVGGPTYAIQDLDIPTHYLDIPTDSDSTSDYEGPYKGGGQDLFDKAVTCDGSTITFNLNQPVPDFNQTVSLLAFAAVPNPTDHPAVDTGDAYDTAGPGTPWSDGPYMIQSNRSGIGGSLVIVRNPNWDPSTDNVRGAYPDTWEVEFGVDPKVADQRLIESSGKDAFALEYGSIDPSDIASLFVSPSSAASNFAGRAFSDYNGYADYLWIRTDNVPNQLIRQAMGVALDREALRAAAGGEYALDSADGVLVPNIGADYAPTHLWDADGPFGQVIPAAGDAQLAKQLIEQSGEVVPTVMYAYISTSQTSNATSQVIQSSLEEAGFKVELFDEGFSYGPPSGDFGKGGWAADWPDASTVIPQIFAEQGYNLSHVTSSNYPDFQRAVQDAITTGDPVARASKWQALNNEVGQQMFVIPTFFERAQYLAGSAVGGAYRWAPYASWPYSQLYAKP